MRKFAEWIKLGVRATRFGQACTIIEIMPDSSGMGDVMVRYDIAHERLGTDFATAQTDLRPA